MAEEQTPKNLPIKITDTPTFDTGLVSMREIFLKEMRRFDEEMNRLSENMLRVFDSTSTMHSEKDDDAAPSWQLLSSSPLIEGEGEDRRYKLRFDVSNFEPSEVNVNIVNNKVIVSAKHEKRTDNSTVIKQYSRAFQFPHNVDPKSIVSSLSKDGVLIVEAPFPALEAPKLVIGVGDSGHSTEVTVAVRGHPTEGFCPEMRLYTSPAGCASDVCWGALTQHFLLPKTSFNLLFISMIVFFIYNTIFNAKG